MHSSLCDWHLDLLTGRIGNRTSANIITNTGIPQGCVLNTILYTLLTCNCVTSHNDNFILMFVDDTAVISCITRGDKLDYRIEAVSLVSLCEDNNLTFTTGKTKEMILDLRKNRRSHQLLFIQKLAIESFEYLDVYISVDLTWTLNNTQLDKMAQQLISIS